MKGDVPTTNCQRMFNQCTGKPEAAVITQNSPSFSHIFNAGIRCLTKAYLF